MPSINHAMEQIRRTVFNSERLSIRHITARPSLRQRDGVEVAGLPIMPQADLLLMPMAGLFARHDAAKQHFIANSNHALFLGCGKPCHLSFPGDIGDECLVLEFSKTALATLLTDMLGVQTLHAPGLDSHCLLAPTTMLDRDLLWRHLAHGASDSSAIEKISVSLLSASVQAACKQVRNTEESSAVTRRRRQVEMVKEAISLHPMQEWTLDELAQHADVSPYHLARVFREEVGVPIHKYLIRTRLGKALEAMRAEEANLTAIALDAGFANHSHFTSSFRSLFGTTPSRLRSRMASKP